MPIFLSEAWCQAVIEAVEADPQAPDAGRGWRGDVALVVEAADGEPGFAIWARPDDGRIAEWRVLRSPEEVDGLRPAYMARASMKTWRGLIQGEVDPVEAVLFRKLKVAGDMEQVMERLKFKGIARRILDSIKTTFP